MTRNQFLGRPLASCHQCRQRRVKCSRERPSCTECQSRSIRCSGYRPTISPNFKDESEEAARKVEARKRKQLEAKNAALSADRSTPLNRNQHGLPLDLANKITSKHISISILDAALSCFITKYLPGSVLGEFQLHSLYLNVPPGSALSFAVYAPALASLAVDSGQQAIMLLAQSQYTRALHRTNEALRDPRERTTDDTLASVLHLGFFESIAFLDEAVQLNWTTHVLGALELLKARGLRQFDTCLGRELFKAVALGIRFSSAQRQVRVPQELVDFESRSAEVLRPSDYVYHISLVLEAIADIQFRRAADIASPIETVLQCLQLDEVVSAYMKKLGAKSSRADDSPKEVQPDLKAMRRCNSLRIVRFILSGYVQACLAKIATSPHVDDPDDYMSLYSRAEEVMMTMGTEILEAASEILASQVTLNSQYLIFQLYTIANEGLAPAHLRVKARELIKYMGNEGGIPEARRATERMDRMA
ncbi:hypothetical protein GQ53DRAFT_341615 [Thozetella sp. PMI_491]|nr:hypothetical protein GQ53DRAFT_341615 [Thozetella sp. PMI_491]